ncbi:hypothetical protein HUF18_08145 [Thalassolituus sp. ST750PaO-4]|nr:hypothetical protein [Thalassolituus sp. ST750PaO-4]
MLRKLLIFKVLILSLAWSFTVQAAGGEIEFKNHSGHLLTCKRHMYGKYISFFMLQPGESKIYSDLELNKHIRCFYEIDSNRKSTTVITYFYLNAYGTYDFYMTNIKCDKCRTGWRWSTLVVPPSGHPIYNRLK